MTDVVRTPDERFADLPDFDFEPHYVDWEGLRLHYLDEGEGWPVVCFHGEPTWSFLYRKMVGPLVEAGYRVICPDYFGFGRSDKPTDPGAYSYDRHTDAMAAVLDHLDVTGGTAVVQDWGGPIGLRLAVERPPVFSRLVVMNTGLFTGSAPSEGFMQWRRFAEKNKDDLPVRFVMERSQVREWGEDVLDAYDAPFPDPSHKVGAGQFPLLVPLSTDDPGAATMQSVLAALGNWQEPALVLFSADDPVFTPKLAQRLADHIPGAVGPELIENAGHFLQEDAGEEVALRIAEFLDDTNPGTYAGT